MKGTELIKLLRKAGWEPEPRTGSSHIKFKHPDHKNHIIVALHKGKDIPTGTLKAILKQAGIKGH